MTKEGRAFERITLIVLDSLGMGEMPDAAEWGDAGADTLGHICESRQVNLPTLRGWGLGNVRPLSGVAPVESPRASFGRCALRSNGKDTTTGHWEMAGIILEKAFPTYPEGFPADVIERFIREAKVPGILGNYPASGTEIIKELGAEHVATGKPIVYTSADSVFQIAAHEDVIPIQEQYRICKAAFDIVGRGMGVGRVIARPFTGAPGSFKRTANRHDYALDPTGETLLDMLVKHGTPVVSVGKVGDLFAGRGITRSLPTASDRNGVERILEAMGDTPAGLIFANLVDFDAQFGHRNDVDGYAANLERFDDCLAVVLDHLKSTDLLIITADHGNDPTTPSTDHSREHVPLLLTGDGVRAGVDLGTRTTFSDLGQTLAANFNVGPLKHGTSFLGDIVVQHS